MNKNLEMYSRYGTSTKRRASFGICSAWKRRRLALKRKRRFVLLLAEALRTRAKLVHF